MPDPVRGRPAVRIGGDVRPMKFQLQPPIKTNPQSLFFAFTHWILRILLLPQRRKPLFMGLNYISLPPTWEAHLGNVGLRGFGVRGDCQGLKRHCQRPKRDCHLTGCQCQQPKRDCQGSKRDCQGARGDCQRPKRNCQLTRCQCQQPKRDCQGSKRDCQQGWGDCQGAWGDGREAWGSCRDGRGKCQQARLNGETLRQAML